MWSDVYIRPFPDGTVAVGKQGEEFELILDTKDIQDLIFLLQEYLQGPDQDESQE